MQNKQQLWAVANDEHNWLIVDIISGRTKKIGSVGAPRSNYYDNAVKEATRRNRKFGINGYVFIHEQYNKYLNLRKYLGSTIRRE